MIRRSLGYQPTHLPPPDQQHVQTLEHRQECLYYYKSLFLCGPQQFCASGKPLANARGFHEKAVFVNSKFQKSRMFGNTFPSAQPEPTLTGRSCSAIPSSQFLPAASAGSRQGRAKRAVG